jgi:ABC transporter substrate binding protein
MSADSGPNPLSAALLQSLRELGWVEGQSIAIEYRWANGRPDRYPALAAELVGLKVDLIVAGGGTPGALAAKRATSTIPIVTPTTVDRVAEAIVRNKTRVIDVDLASYFDSVRHDRLLAKVARRVNDRDILHLLKLMLKASGKRGVPQGGVISPPPQQHLSHRGGCHAGAGQGGHGQRHAHVRGVRALCR